MPYSQFDPDPNPLLRLWAGPVIGVLAPRTVALIIRSSATWFISHFATLANGLYLATAWATGDRFLDTAQLLEHGASRVMLAAFCLITISTGYFGLRRRIIGWLRSRPGD